MPSRVRQAHCPSEVVGRSLPSPVVLGQAGLGQARHGIVLRGKPTIPWKLGMEVCCRAVPSKVGRGRVRSGAAWQTHHPLETGDGSLLGDVRYGVAGQRLVGSGHVWQCKANPLLFGN